jgi:hypothetical protein
MKAARKIVTKLDILRAYFTSIRYPETAYVFMVWCLTLGVLDFVTSGLPE